MAVVNEPTKWNKSLVNSGDANAIPDNTTVGTGDFSFEEGFPQITQVPLGAGGMFPTPSTGSVLTRLSMVVP